MDQTRIDADIKKTKTTIYDLLCCLSRLEIDVDTFIIHQFVEPIIETAKVEARQAERNRLLKNYDQSGRDVETIMKHTIPCLSKYQAEEALIEARGDMVMAILNNTTY